MRIRKPLSVYLCLMLLAICPLASAEEGKLKALIIDGQNNHGAWPKTTVMMKHFLEESGRFEVDVQRTQYTWKGEAELAKYPLKGFKTEALKQAKPDPDFKPKFSDYDVVVSNFGWGAAPWPQETQDAFEKYMKSGGGLVVVHAADNCFPEWPAYNQMIGIGGWGGRNEKSGPYAYFTKEGKEVRDESPGNGGGHGPQHEFEVVVRNTEHPITKGLPSAWLHTKDELYERLRGPAVNMEILATAYASPKFKGSDRHEPTLMALEYGDGRVFHSTLGHADYSMECVGFITTFLRGSEWAATGEVTITDVPEDFPTRGKIAKREFTK
ncbi:MAG: ThuA domain-containing protein [Planctomycetota bacterium]